MDHINQGIRAMQVCSWETESRQAQSIEQLAGQVQSIALEQTAALGNVVALINKHISDTSHLNARDIDHIPAARLPPGTGNIGSGHIALAENDGLQDALTLLCRFAEEEGKTIASAEAESLIGAIERVFSTSTDAPTAHGFTGSFSSKRERDESNSEEMQYQREMKRLKSLMNSAQAVAVNRKGKPKAQSSSNIYLTNTNKHSQLPGLCMLL